MEWDSIEGKAWRDAEYKILEAATILLYSAKKLTTQPNKKQTVDKLNNQALELLNTIEKNIAKIYLDDNDRLSYRTEEQLLEDMIDADVCRSEYEAQKQHDSLYDENLDMGMGTYLSDGVYIQSDGSLVDTKSGK